MEGEERKREINGSSKGEKDELNREQCIRKGRWKTNRKV